MSTRTESVSSGGRGDDAITVSMNSIDRLDAVIYPHTGEDVSTSPNEHLVTLQIDIDAQKSTFQDALQSYISRTAGSKYKTSLDLHAAHTWEDVLVAVDNASKVYAECPGKWGKLRKGLRRVGRADVIFGAWSGLLPSQSEYFSVLCGGLKLIFGAAGQLKDLRDEIVEALEEIPTLFAITRKAVGLFNESEEIRASAVELHVATLGALEHIVRWYTASALKKFTKALLRQESYEQDMKDKIQAIQKASARFERAAQMCSYEYIVDTNLNIKEHQRLDRDRYQELLQRTKAIQEQTIMNGDGLRQTISDESGMMQRAIVILTQRVVGLEQVAAVFAKPPSLDSELRSGYRQILPSSHDTRGLLQHKVDHEKSSITKLFLQVLLGSELSTMSFAEDAAHYRRPVESLQRAAQDRVVAVIKTDKFQNWMCSPASSLLFVNCNAAQLSSLDSPSSFICAKFSDSIGGPGPDAPVILNFFCRSRSSQPDPLYGARGLWRSLVAQLLPHIPNQRALEVLVSELSERNLRSSKSLQRLFGMLLDLFPRTAVVFCVVDSINIYEDKNEVADEVESVVKALENLVLETASEGCVFKTLLACQWNSRRYHKRVADEGRVLWLSSNVPRCGPLTEASWAGMMEKEFRFLT